MNVSDPRLSLCSCACVSPVHHSKLTSWRKRRSLGRDRHAGDGEARGWLGPAMVTNLRRPQACATRRQRSRILRVRCKSGSSCEDDEAKTKDDGREGEAESARGRRGRARRRHVRRNSCSRSAARAAMQVVLLELDKTRAEQGDDVGRFKMADASEMGFGRTLL